MKSKQRYKLDGSITLKLISTFIFFLIQGLLFLFELTWLGNLWFLCLLLWSRVRRITLALLYLFVILSLLSNFPEQSLASIVLVNFFLLIGELNSKIDFRNYLNELSHWTKRRILFPLMGLFFLNLARDFISEFPQLFLQFLSFGYDNAAHLGLYRVYFNELSYPFSINSSWENNFDLFQTYPPGYALLTSFLSTALFPRTTLPEEFMANFLITLLLVFVFALLLAIQLYKKYATEDRFLHKLFLAFLVLYPWGILLTNGFGPYLGGIVILQLFFLQKERFREPRTLLLPLVCCCSLLLITTTSLAIVLLPWIVICAFDLAKNLSRYRSNQLLFLFISCSIITLSSFHIYWNTSKRFGWRQLLGDGGVQPPSLSYSLILSLALLFVFISLRSKARIDHNLITLIISLSISVLALMFITWFFTGGIRYYAIKQFHVFAGFAVLFLVIALGYLKPHVNRLILWSLKILIILSTSLGVLAPKTYTGAFMGHFAEISKALIAKEQWRNQMVDAYEITSLGKLSSNYGGACRIYRISGKDSDLNSRWLNALYNPNSITSECFFAFWNKAEMSLTAFVSQDFGDRNMYVIFVENDKVDLNSNTLNAGNVILKAALLR